MSRSLVCRQCKKIVAKWTILTRLCAYSECVMLLYSPLFSKRSLRQGKREKTKKKKIPMNAMKRRFVYGGAVCRLRII